MIPGRLMTSGMMRWSRSMNVTTISAATNVKSTSHSTPKPTRR